ncbi:MAG: hypothetical protein VWZ86_03175 [Flavobacteriaceae bacterium]
MKNLRLIPDFFSTIRYAKSLGVSCCAFFDEVMDIIPRRTKYNMWIYTKSIHLQELEIT